MAPARQLAGAASCEVTRNALHVRRGALARRNDKFLGECLGKSSYAPVAASVCMTEECGLSNMFSWDFEFADVQRDITIASTYPGDSEPLRGIRAEYLPESCLQDCYELIRCACQRRHDALRGAAPFPESSRPEGPTLFAPGQPSLTPTTGCRVSTGEAQRSSRGWHEGYSSAARRGRPKVPGMIVRASLLLSAACVRSPCKSRRAMQRHGSVRPTAARVRGQGLSFRPGFAPSHAHRYFGPTQFG